MAEDKLRHSDVSGVIIKGFYHVYNTLGHGFLEKAYENALTVTLRKSGLVVEQQVPITVYFEGVEVGKYAADLLVASGSSWRSKRPRPLWKATRPN